MEAAKKMKQVLGFVKDTFGQESDGDVSTNSASSSWISVERMMEVRKLLGPEDEDTLTQDFLVKCLLQHRGAVQPAADVARAFLTFRRSASWPLRIAAQDVETPLRTGMHWLLPARTHCEQRWCGEGGNHFGPTACIVYNACKLDPRICPVSEYQKMGSFLMERATDDNATQERGVALIVDNAGVELLPMLKIMSLSDMRRGVLMWKGAFPCLLKRIWMVDAPPGSGAVVKALLRLLAPKVRERIRFARRSGEKGLSELVEDLGGIFDLPKSLGGETEIDWDSMVTQWVLKDPLVAESNDDASRSPMLDPAL